MAHSLIGKADTLPRTTTTLCSRLCVAATLWLCTMHTTAATSSVTASAAAASGVLTLHVDVQNMPRSAAARGATGHIVLRVATPQSTQKLENLLRDRLQVALLQPSHDETKIAFDLEFYDHRLDRFVSLSDVKQLTHRSRLNVRLRDSEDRESCLALPARIFDLAIDKGEFRVNGHAVLIGEVENSGLGTGLTTWDGSVVLAKYLEHSYAGKLKGKRVLEVGAGTGLVGISAALVGAGEVILTDLEYTMANLARNVARTLDAAGTAAVHGAMTTRVLDWLSPPSDVGDLDLILASDVVWVEELIPPLVSTLHALTRASRRPTTILLSHQQRSVASDVILFRELDARGFQHRLVPESELHPVFASAQIQIWELLSLTHSGQGTAT